MLERRLRKAAIMKLNEKGENIEQILEAAVVVNWADLIRGGQRGLIHIEYGFAPSGTLDYLKVWSSIKRGYWLLRTGCQPPNLTIPASTSITDLNRKVWRTFSKL